jgi:hypothetical protein
LVEGVPTLHWKHLGLGVPKIVKAAIEALVKRVVDFVVALEGHLYLVGVV